jgi:DNA-binding MarR family transcriptional regulator
MPTWVPSQTASSSQLIEFFRQAPSRVEVLKAIYNSGEVSRAEVARITGLTKVTVSEVVNQMQSLGLIQFSAPMKTASPGKRPILVQLRRDAVRIIAVDLSSPDSVRVGSVDLFGSVLGSTFSPLRMESIESLIEGVQAAIEKELDASEMMVLGIGVGVAGIVDPNGKVIDGAALELHGFDLQAELAKRLGLDVRVANDANVATVADLLFGGGESSHLLIRISKGVGAGILLDGVPYLGSNFAAGELGHVVVVPEGALCKCGKQGCLEAEIATRLSGGFDEIELGALLGSAIAPIASALNLPEIVIACEELDGVAFLDAVFSEIQRTTLPSISQNLTVRYSRLGKDVVLLGAAAFSLSSTLGVA